MAEVMQPDKTNGLGQTIKVLREMRKMTQRQLADRVGMSRTSIINIEAGNQMPTVKHMNAIAGALDSSVHVQFVPVAP